MHFLRTFGCVVHVKNVKSHLKKLDNRSTPMIFVGYESGSKTYRVYDPVNKRVHVTRNVMFDELVQWKSSLEEHEANGDDSFTVEYVINKEPTCDTRMSSPNHGRTPPLATPVGAVDRTPVAIEHITPPTHDSGLDADADDDAPQRYHIVDSFLGSTTP